MKLFKEKGRLVLAVALSIAVGFAAGFISKDALDAGGSARASEPAAVPVTKVTEAESGKLNRLISPNLWDIYVDPFMVPVSWAMRPLPLVPLMSFPLETPKLQTIDGDKELRVIAQVPAMNEKDVKVEASERAVTIKAHKRREAKDSGKFETVDEVFEQSVNLPAKVNADKVLATVKDGVLTVTLPKK
jgi:HSP20 family molecular chaperone IbpA